MSRTTHFPAFTPTSGTLVRECARRWGDKDFVFDHHFAAEWQRRFPDAEWLRFPDGGHYILEDAAEELIPAIRRFLLSTSERGA